MIQYLRIFQQVRGAVVMPHRAARQEIDPISDAAGQFRILLLKQRHRQSLGAEPAQRLADFADHNGSEPERWLVQDEQTRIGHKPHRYRYHLLLPA